MLKFTAVRENLCNVELNGRESNWYVEKSRGWYEILWGRQDDLLSFREQSWFSSQDKEDIKEKLAQCVRRPVEIRTSERHDLKYVYQGK
jgi:hypothetical protein